MSALVHDLASSWSLRLGLAREALFGPEDGGEAHHVLLDGADGSFALSTEWVEEGRALDWAWSARLRHHVLVQDERVVVRHVGSAKPPRTFDRRVTDERLERFFELLVEEKARPQVDVVEHILTVFRGHRLVCRRFGAGDEFVLRTFLYLLRGAIDGTLHRDEGRKELGPLLFQNPDYRAKFQQSISVNPIDGRTLDLRLTLRHASGGLFQEAHSELTADFSQGDLFNLPRGKSGAASVSGVGAYYTPTALARSVADLAVTRVSVAPSETFTVLDPACGSGSFLIEAAHALRRKRHDGPIHLIGYDVSETAVEMARFAVAEAGIPGPLSADLHKVESFLTQPEAGAFADVVVMNPPFLGVGLLQLKEQEAVKKELGSSFGYRPDISQAFVSKALRAVRTGGRLGTFLPIGVLASSFGKDWRASLIERANIELIAVLGSHDLFRDAMVNVAVMMLAPGLPHGDTQMIWAGPKRDAAASALRALRRFGREDLGDRKGPGWSAYRMRPEMLVGRPSWAPSPNALGPLLPKLERDIPARVTDLFAVELGIRSSRNRSLFVISEAQYEQLDEREQAIFRPIAEKDAIRNGRIHATSFLFYPERDLTAGEIKKLYPKYYRMVLAPVKPPDAEVLKLERSRRRSMLARDPCIVSRAFAWVGAFAVDERGEHVVFQGYSWRPKRPLTSEKLPILDMLADYNFVFNSRVFIMLAREYSPVQAGGQIDLAQHRMANVPLPNLAQVYQENPDLAMEAGRLRDLDRIRFPDLEELDRFTAAVYGLEVKAWPSEIPY